MEWVAPKVGAHEPGEGPPLIQGGAEQVLVLAGGLAVDRAVGAHHRGRLGPLGRGPERGQVDLVQRPRAHDRVVGRGVAVGLLVVHREVLDLRHHPLALHPVDLRHGDRRVQERVLGIGLERPAPARVPVDVHRRPQVDRLPLTALLGPDHLPVLGRQRPVPGGRQGYPGRQLGDAGQAVAHPVGAVLQVHGRDAQARDGRDVPRAGHHADLVGQRHPGQQQAHPLAGRQRPAEPRARRGGGRR